MRKTGFSRLVLASSGGADSAVVCQIACDAIGPENVHAIRMPSIFSSDHSRDDALALHENLGCVDYELPIDHEATVEFLNATLSEGKDGDNLVVQKITDGYGHVADENIQPACVICTSCILVMHLMRCRFPPATKQNLPVVTTRTLT